MRKIIDAFSFFNEFDILKLRLNYLNDIIDYFIIAECNHTHSAIPKPYYLDQIIDDIPEDIRKKIIRIKYEVNGYEYYNDAWRLEGEQRNFISKNLENFSLNDFIMISDVDEIPRKETIIKSFSNWNKDNLQVVKCEFFYYNFNTFLHNHWDGTVFSSVENCIRKGGQFLRQERNTFKPLENGGWHFSYFGDVEKIKLKINSFAHQEINTDEYKNNSNIINSINNKKCFHDENYSFTDYEFDHYPEDLKKLIINFFPKEYFAAS